jgi:hypothetical protein
MRNLLLLLLLLLLCCCCAFVNNSDFYFVSMEMKNKPTSKQTIFAVYRENHIKYKNTICKENSEFLMLKEAVYVFTTVT